MTTLCYYYTINPSIHHYPLNRPGHTVKISSDGVLTLNLKSIGGSVLGKVLLQTISRALVEDDDAPAERAKLNEVRKAIDGVANFTDVTFDLRDSSER